MVWRYIMFCAKTRPVPVASTDFGEIAPLIVSTSRNGRSTAGNDATVVVVAAVRFATVARLEVEVGPDDTGVFVAAGASAPRVGWLSVRTTTANTTAARRATALTRRCWRRFTDQIVAN